MNFNITRQYATSIPITLDKNGNVFAIEPSTQVKAALMSFDLTRVLIPAITLNANTSGANWGSSIVLVNFTKEQTAALRKQGPCMLEISVDDGTLEPWRIQGKVVFGGIAQT